MDAREEIISREDFRLRLNQIREKACLNNKSFVTILPEALKKHSEEKYRCMGPGILALWLVGICAPYPSVRGEILAVAEAVASDKPGNTRN